MSKRGKKNRELLHGLCHDSHLDFGNLRDRRGSLVRDDPRTWRVKLRIRKGENVNQAIAEASILEEKT